MTENSIFKALATVFPAPAHTLLSQVRNGTGFSRGPRTIDALAISTYPSRGLWLAGIEIKRYRGDWKRELADGDKAEAIQKYCHYWYVAAPEGLIPRNELPETWGLIEVGKSCKIAAKATRLEPKPLDMLLLCSILRNVSESTVPAETINDLVQAKAADLEKHRSSELSMLREHVAAFEEASGVNLQRAWDYGDIGKAVKIVRDSGLLHASNRLQNLRNEAAKVVDAVDEIFGSLKGREHVA